MIRPFVRSAFNYVSDDVSFATGLACEDGSRTKQSFVEECDINTIVRRFGVTGELPEGVRAPSYGDFTAVVDYHSACNAIAGARESFEMMPAEIRAEFHNDPQEFLVFVDDDKNRDRAVKMGLVLAKPPVESIVPAGRDGAAPIPEKAPVPPKPAPKPASDDQ